MLNDNSPFWQLMRFLCMDFAIVMSLFVVVEATNLPMPYRAMIMHNFIAWQFALAAALLALPHLWRWWRWVMGTQTNVPVRLGSVARFPWRASTWKPVALRLAPQQLPPGPHDAHWRQHCGFALRQAMMPLAYCVCLTILFAWRGNWMIIFSASMYVWVLGGLCELGLAAMGLQPRWIEANSPTTYLASYMGVVRTVPVERIAAMADMQSGAIVIDVDGTFSIRVHPAALPLDEAE